MKVKSVLLTALVAAFAAGSIAVRAADEAAPTKPAADEPKAEKAPVKKKAKRHSHMQEKTGVPTSDPSPTDEPKKKLHDHTKEK